ncbi:hypothetical protein [Nocardia arthritidis]|uniref:Uncharacterized protein n=1 Tax=Nocardia arthritidis TaxID=228602 RepID=A0A6G9YKR7_9NOCA|nr:hypothetical protein [Nocardia arthritidis]QIS13802.1 hypothetical protein F5544_29785 [Nocardia arthritidis]
MSIDDLQGEPEAETVPAGWWKLATPIRGHGPAVERPVLAELVAEITEWLGDLPERLDCLRQLFPDDDTTLYELADSYLRDPDSARPESAAAAGLFLAQVTTSPSLAHYLAANHGLPYAAQTMALLSELTLTDHRKAKVGTLDQEAPIPLPIFGTTELLDPHIRELRELLAAATDDEYAEARTRLAAIRTRSAHARLAASYLVPTEQDWVAADIELTGWAVSDELAAARLLTTVRDIDLAHALVDRIAPRIIDGDPRIRYSLGVNLGLDVPPILGTLYRRTRDPEARKGIATMLLELDTHEGDAELTHLAGDEHVDEALAKVVELRPRRAFWLLGNGALSGQTDALFRIRIRHDPEYARAVVDWLPQAMAAIVREELAQL